MRSLSFEKNDIGGPPGNRPSLPLRGPRGKPPVRAAIPAGDRGAPARLRPSLRGGLIPLGRARVPRAGPLLAGRSRAIRSDPERRQGGRARPKAREAGIRGRRPGLAIIFPRPGRRAASRRLTPGGGCHRTRVDASRPPGTRDAPAEDRPCACKPPPLPF